jgi:hypothetical protein
MSICVVLHVVRGTHADSASVPVQALEAAGYGVAVQPAEASTQGLVRELMRRGEADGARVLCPVPKVTGARSALSLQACGKLRMDRDHCNPK